MKSVISLFCIPPLLLAAAAPQHIICGFCGCSMPSTPHYYLSTHNRPPKSRSLTMNFSTLSHWNWVSGRRRSSRRWNEISKVKVTKAEDGKGRNFHCPPQSTPAELTLESDDGSRIRRSRSRTTTRNKLILNVLFAKRLGDR